MSAAVELVTLDFSIGLPQIILSGTRNSEISFISLSETKLLCVRPLEHTCFCDPRLMV